MGFGPLFFVKIFDGCYDDGRVFLVMETLEERNNFFLNQQKLRSPLSLPDNNDEAQFAESETDISSWIKNQSKILLHPQFFPSPEGVKNYSKLLDTKLKPKDNVEKYKDVSGCDPHLMSSLINLYEIEKRIGANPDDQSTYLNFRPSLLLSLGCGDGKLLKELIDKYKPFHICIALRSWADLSSSFDEIDWCNLWNQKCENAYENISIMPYNSIKQLQIMLADIALVTSEHGFIIAPGPMTNVEYLSDRNQLHGREMEVAVNYLGFAMDEYNMLWNSVDALKRLPRIYCKPSVSVGGNFVVCGSGPSLDKNIHLLKKLPSDWTIIACASNYRTLRQAGIDVDILCLLERESLEYENYLTVKEEFGLGKTKLFASITCDGRLHDLFEDSMVYFRPALSPLSLFCTNEAEILLFEGPQTVNTGVALCSSLGADTIVLVGVDLGTTNLEEIRSKSAVGTSNRKFEHKVPGNFADFAFSDSLLLDGLLSMETCLRNHPNINVLNSSNGVFIKGATPTPLEQVLNDTHLNPHQQTNWISWWNKRGRFDAKTLIMHWQASRPRAHVSNTFKNIREVLNGNTPWFPDVQDKLNRLLSLNVPINQQIGPRIARGVLLKLAITVSRQSYVMLCQDPSGNMQKKFMKESRLLLTNLCTELETEVYELFDQLEAELQTYSSMIK